MDLHLEHRQYPFERILRMEELSALQKGTNHQLI
jgi:hypothetical protein